MLKIHIEVGELLFFKSIELCNPAGEEPKFSQALIRGGQCHCSNYECLLETILILS